MLTTYDRSWTFLGLPLAAMVVSLAVFSRTGSLTLLSVQEVGDAMKITAGYWGLLLSSFGLLALGTIAVRYLRVQADERSTEPPWPRLAGIEDEGRDRVISTVFFSFIVGTPVVGWFVFLIRYLDSRIAGWNATGLGKELGGGFFSSRWHAMFASCDGQPCWRIHLPDGHQYITWLSDPAILIGTTTAIVVWATWSRTVLRRDSGPEARQPSTGSDD